MTNIIFGYDGFESARRAADRALGPASEGSTITVVSVLHPLAGKGGLAYDPIEAEDFAHRLDEVSARVRERGLECRKVEGLGDPAKIIAGEAERHGDLVIVGSEHKNLIERLLFGSVSIDVVHRSPIDVLVVR